MISTKSASALVKGKGTVAGDKPQQTVEILKQCRIPGKTLKVGEVCTLDVGEANILLRLGRAKKAEKKAEAVAEKPIKKAAKKAVKKTSKTVTFD